MPYDPKELDEALYALAKLLNSGKASIDPDGKLTFSDAINFIDDVIPVWNGISGAQNAILKLSEMTAEQKEERALKFLEALSFSPVDENAFDKTLDWLYATLDMFKAWGVVKEPPTPAAV